MFQLLSILFVLSVGEFVRTRNKAGAGESRGRPIDPWLLDDKRNCAGFRSAK